MGLAAKCWARQRKHFQGFWAICLVAQLSAPSKKRCCSTQEFTRFLSTVSSQRRGTRSDVLFQTKSSECWLTVELTPHTYIPLRERLYLIPVVCSPSRSRRMTQIILTEALLLNHHQRIGRQNKKHQIKCIPEWLRRRFPAANAAGQIFETWMHRRQDL